MSNIFASVDRMSTGAKLFFVAIGVLIMLAYSLENERVAQQPAQTQTSTPAPVTTPTPSSAPLAQTPPAAGRTAKKPETTTKSIAVNNAPESIQPSTPADDAVTSVPKTLTTLPPTAVVIPENAPAEIAPENPVRPNLQPSELPPPGYFTVGSTKDDVLRTQGSPKAMNESQWAYGLSSVQFQNGRVVTWNASLLTPLKAVLLPHNVDEAAAARTRGFFTIGSTTDEVLGVQGTPTRFSDTYWTYGLSSVEFSGGTVAGWNVSPLNPLRSRLLPADQAESVAAKALGYFTVGSTRDEVLGVQGTPSRFSDTLWAYGISSVDFQNGHVTTWNSSPLNPLRVALVPQRPEDTAAALARGYFTLGSTKDEVLGAQGTPSSFSDTHWAYGISSISFQNGRVISWNSSPLNPLKVRNQP